MKAVGYSVEWWELSFTHVVTGVLYRGPKWQCHRHPGGKRHRMEYTVCVTSSSLTVVTVITSVSHFSHLKNEDKISNLFYPPNSD